MIYASIKALLVFKMCMQVILSKIADATYVYHIVMYLNMLDSIAPTIPTRKGLTRKSRLGRTEPESMKIQNTPTKTTRFSRYPTPLCYDFPPSAEYDSSHSIDMCVTTGRHNTSQQP